MSNMALSKRVDLLPALRHLQRAFLGPEKPDSTTLIAVLAELTGSTGTIAAHPAALSPAPGEAILAVPVLAGTRWLGDVVLRRTGAPFSADEELLAEFGAALAAAVLTANEAHDSEADDHRRSAARAAASSLSITERRAMSRLLQAWTGGPVTVRLKDAAEDAGVHHSSLVQALARLRAAGVIQAGSRGRRGVRLHVLNPLLLDELHD